jgi:hypothetical protein
VSVTASDIDLFRDRMAGGWILSESKSMQELVNDDDLRPLGIPLKRQSESISAHENGRGPGLCEREPSTLAALRGSLASRNRNDPKASRGLFPLFASLVERRRPDSSSNSVKRSWQPGRAMRVAAPPDREPHRQSRFDIPESIDARCLGTGAPHHQRGHQGAGKNPVRAHGLLLSGGPSRQWPNEPLPD